MWSTKPAEYSRHRCLHIRLHSLIEIQSSRSVLSDSATPWIAACQASLSITNSRSLLKFMSIQAVMPSNHLILCHPLLLLPSIFLSFRVFSNESVLCINTLATKYRSFSFNIGPSNEYSGYQWIFMVSRSIFNYSVPWAQVSLQWFVSSLVYSSLS